jgi:Tol biopolymer transport system component
MSLRYIIPSLIIILSCVGDGLSQAINTEFGKNRVQYHNDFNNWSRYETENFITYWYGKSRNIAQPVIQLSEFDHDEIQRTLEYTLSDKIEIIVYIDINDLKQSNIGLEDAFTNTAGITKIQGNKMFVYFDGNHLNLRKQIRKGIANVYLNSILFGTSIQEIVQNALLLNLPDWFNDGLVNYAGSNWDYEIDDELRDLLAHNKKFKKFSKIAEEHPRVAGHSMWNYISETYGSTTIANIIYLTRIHRNLENSFLFITGDDFEKIQKSWYEYYKNQYSLEEGKFALTEDLLQEKLKNKKGVPVSVMKLNPAGTHLAYATHNGGKVKIFLREIATGIEKRIFKKGYKNTFQEADYNYPHIAWHPRKNELSIMYEHRDITYLRRLRLSSDEYEEQTLTEDFQRVYSMDYLNDDDYVFSASKDGYSDLYVYRSDTRGSTRLTEDFFDDLDATVVNYEGQQSILFRSNRTTLSTERQRLDTILPIEQFDVYLLQGLGKKDERTISKLTSTPNYSEQQPQMIADKKLLYLSDQSGILNAYVRDLESGSVTGLTNLERNIILYGASKVGDEWFYSYYDDGNYKVFSSIMDIEAVDVKKTIWKNRFKSNNEEVLIPYQPKDEKQIEITQGNMFQSEYEDPENLIPLEDYLKEEEVSSVFDKYFNNYFSGSIQDGKRVIKYSPMRATVSRTQFRLADFTTRLDNSVLFEGLESYTGNDRELGNPTTGILFKGIVKDLFEDYEIQIGLRIPTTFRGYEYFAVFDNNKNFIDQRFAFYRKAETNVIDPNTFPLARDKRHTFLGLYRAKYPFDIYNSLRLTGSLRFDKYFRLITDAVSFNEPFVNEKRLSLKAEYVFDNSYDISVNIKNGSRVKFYSEIINSFDLDFNNGLNVDLSNGYTGVLGFDARHYIPIFKDAVLALRGAGAVSVGSNRIVYYLGGVENWILNSFDQSIPVPESESFSYKVLAPNLRGFQNNARNGNSYLLTNTELRVPIFRFLGLRKTGMAFLKNFQVAGFFDAGLAWYGPNPNDEENLLNNIQVQSPTENPVIQINARYFRDPLVLGYGFGFRSTLLGYFVKLDYAWGVETREVLDPRLYLSLGFDF